MKLAIFYVAALAANVIAVAIESPSGDSNNVLSHFDDAPANIAGGDHIVEGRDSTATIGSAELVGSQAETLPPTTTVLDMKPLITPTITAELLSFKQHVGQVHGYLLYGHILQALDWYLCPLKDGTRRCLAENDPKNDYRIQGVLYNDKGKPNSKAHVKIWVESSRFAENESGLYKGLSFLFMETIARIWLEQTLDPKNCYWAPVKGEKLWWCNAGNRVNLRFGNDEWLIVRLEFNGKTTDGQFDCPAICEAAERSIKNAQAKKYQEVLNQPDVAFNVHCALKT